MKFFDWLAQVIIDMFVPKPKVPDRIEVPTQPATYEVPKVVSAPLNFEEYEVKFRVAKVRPEHLAYLKSHCSKILAHSDQYEKVEKATGMPWDMVACIHSLEGSLNFGTHLHNGDPLNSRTVHVPAGQPESGSPPFTWFDSAIDALGGPGKYKGKKWTLGERLSFLETYNGLGYRRRRLASPYLWSFTDQYVSGKYVADGVFDAGAVSRQAGAVAIMKVLGMFRDNPISA